MLVDPLVLLAFLPAALALNLTPGADMMFCLGQGLRGGWRAGQAANLGIAAGGMVHVTLAALGLAAVRERHELLLRTAGVLGVSGKIQSAHGGVHLVAESLWDPRAAVA